MKHPIFYKKLGVLLKKLRKEAGVTQTEIADKCNFSTAQFISNVERGLCGPSDKVLVKMVKLYKMDNDTALSVANVVIKAQQARLNKLLKITKSK